MPEEIDGAQYLFELGLMPRSGVVHDGVSRGLSFPAVRVDRQKLGRPGQWQGKADGLPFDRTRNPRDVIFHKERIHHRHGYGAEQRASHERPPEKDIALD